MDKTLKWGIIGPGRIAAQFAAAIPSANRSVLQAVHSSDMQRAQKFATEFNAQTHYNDLEAFLADTNVDVVYIANPHPFHADSIETVLRAGKPVLCEKPLTVDAKQADRLFELAKSKQLFLMEGMWTRFMPVWQQVRKWIDAGQIGDIKLMNSSFGFPVPRLESDRHLNLELAGGVLLDMGVYNVSMSQFVMQQNPTSQVSSVLKGNTGVDELTCGILQYNHVVSQFSCGFESLLENAFTIHGSKGNITVPSPFWASTKALLQPHDGEPVEFNEAFRCNGFEYEIMEVERCLAQGDIQSKIMPWGDTVNVLETMNEILLQGGIEYPFTGA